MKLSDRCKQEFNERDRSRGRQYFFQEAVEIVEYGPHGVEAAVRGSEPQPYTVRLNWSGAAQGVMLADCTCPRFADEFICKHVWATILEADSMRMEGDAPGRGILEIYTPGESGEVPVYEDVSGAIQLMHEGGEEGLAALGGTSATATQPAQPGPWEHQLQFIRQQAFAMRAARETPVLAAKPKWVFYNLALTETRSTGQIIIELMQREPRRDGTYGKLKQLSVSQQELRRFPEQADQDLLSLLVTVSDSEVDHRFRSYYGYQPKFNRARLPAALHELVLPKLSATGRFGLEQINDDGLPEIQPLAWDDGPAWQIEVHVEDDTQAQEWLVSGRLTRETKAGREERPLSQPLVLLACGLVIFEHELARLDAGDAFPWITLLRREHQIHVPYGREQALWSTLYEAPSPPPAVLPAQLELTRQQLEPVPRVSFKPYKKGYRQSPLLIANVSFLYNEQPVRLNDPRRSLVDAANHALLLRDMAAEEQWLASLHDLPFEPPPSHEHGEYDLRLPQKRFIDVSSRLIGSGWLVEAEGNVLRKPGEFRMSVSSGVDWFDVAGSVDFDGQHVGLPQLLAAVRRGDKFIKLDDGTQGMLPEDWIQRYAPLANLAQDEEGENVRFAPSQAAVLDALLAAEPNVDVDRKFANLARKLREFEGVAPKSEPRGFQGTLRDYQHEGLGWLSFLQDFNFGGCLADDMGLGKTVQVLALLQSRRLGRRTKDGEQRKPSLVVAPRSLIYNWLDEAVRFTPRLKMLRYTGTDRKQYRDTLHEYDCVITTYGTLRRDAALLKDVQFDYAVLDEAQAIKNSNSQAAKACRLLKADHRLALTGTPVENHLGELWSIFEFLNPGMLGRTQALKAFTSSNGNGNGEGEASNVKLLARALRPFILRRTKEQVLRELPEKTEQTLHCQLDRKQRELYDELRDHYRAALTQKIKEVGIKRAKIHVLEALLRLRQAACHPGLIDESRRGERSAKIHTLVDQLQEIVGEGHKALVFSQFTKLLSIVRDKLDADNVPYEYLDGRTRKRKDRVERFQNDPDCKLFLISLKAGGLGLNLTAADYVFILDPWWNPAVEAQAVDRAHRIGQTKPVFAYRLIAKDTVEEKILELQQSKRKLADAIISADNSLISDLSAEDLRLLLS